MPHPGDDEQAGQSAPALVSDPKHRPQSSLVGWRARAVGALMPAAGLALLQSLDTFSEAGAARLSALVLAWYTVWFWSRLMTHIELKYLQSKTAAEKKLAWLVVLELPIALVFTASVPYIWLTASQSSAGDRTFVIGIVLLAFVAFHSAVLAHYVERTNKRRGSECAHLCRIVQRLLEGAKRLHLERVAKEFMRKTAVTTVSAHIVWTLLGLTTVVAINTPAVAPHALRLVNAAEPFERASATRDEVGKADSRHRRSPRRFPRTGRRRDDRTASPAREQQPQQPPATYEALCGGKRTPGAKAPMPQKRAIHRAWFGPGAAFAGCAKRAHRVHPDGVWISAGTCVGRLRSLAVADANGVGALLLWGPARFALRQAKRGQLLRSTSRETAGAGDLHAITTLSGVYVFIRRWKSDGSGAFETAPRSCRQVHEDPVKYLPLPPALVRLWLAHMATLDQWLWPVLVFKRGTIRRYRFIADDPVMGSAITARCSSDTTCELTADGASTSTRGRGGIDVKQLLGLVPDSPDGIG